MLIPTFFFAILEWLAIHKGWRRLEYLAKPAVMLCLLAWVALNVPLRGALWWFVSGLVFSLAGDVFLLLPNERRGFILGLGAFLLAHISYIIGLNIPPMPITRITLGIVLFVWALSFAVGRPIYRSLRKKGLRKLLIPVQLYITALGMMLISALSTLIRTDWGMAGAVLVSVGAGLFTVSDSLLAWNKFVHPMRHGRLLLMITYHLAQVALTLGAAQQFG